jgi:hypothetical protein
LTPVQVYIPLTVLTGERAEWEMPTEISDTEQFVRISERATECRVKRLKDIVKLKLRTASQLYTIKIDPEQAAVLLKQIRCEVIEAP